MIYHIVLNKTVCSLNTNCTCDLISNYQSLLDLQLEMITVSIMPIMPVDLFHIFQMLHFVSLNFTGDKHLLPRNYCYFILLCVYNLLLVTYTPYIPKGLMVMVKSQCLQLLRYLYSLIIFTIKHAGLDQILQVNNETVQTLFYRSMPTKLLNF